MTGRLRGKNVVITGASSGIGKAIALLFAQEEAALCLVARRAKELSNVANQCRSYGITARDIVADITKDVEVQEMARETLNVFNRIDILINNAGYGKYGPFTSLNIEEWDRMWLSNVRGMVLVTQAFVPFMIAAKGGHILNMSSIHGIDTSANATAYCATKFAVTGFSEALSKELYREGIKVSTVCPGGVLTPFLGISPHKKNPDFLEAEEVAEAVLGVVTAPGKALIQRIVVVPRNRPFTIPEIK